LTLPPSNSGAPVISATSFTASLASLRALAVPPDATKVRPSAWSFSAKGSRPALSDTLSSAKKRIYTLNKIMVFKVLTQLKPAHKIIPSTVYLLLNSVIL
jgi:hypothetical protein